ncbi:MAG: hypothetical protein EPN79_11185 [Burkholderiaceae bacterium]|nr:MAG: hypothetical protein EPN79_11185 [Burkholderiaceae bacterium]TBR76752.1 MAG: hypothetical protein EPN64_05890 [Burkholderiaceae bacterium]
MSLEFGSREFSGPSRNPLPSEVRAAREAAGLTQTEAAALVHTSCRTWQQWEAGDRRMHQAFWELFRIKISTRSVRISAPIKPHRSQRA